MSADIGKALRDARTEKGIELSEVERVTKIREKFLSAMEEDRWEELPAPVYAKGFLSTYARYLGLDEGPLLDRYREAFGDPERPEHVPAGVVHTGEMRRGGGPSSRSLTVAALVTVVLLGLVIAAVIGGTDSGGGKSGDKGHKATVAAKPRNGTTSSATSTTSTSTTATSTTTPSQVAVELRSTADVWICLVDQSGRRLVNSETLAADQTRGPFTGTGFEMTFGNGSVELTVNGQSVSVPQLAQPLGYRITTTEVKRLKPSSQPTCV